MVRAVSAALPLGIIIVSGIVYHVAQKGSGAASPWPMLAVAYGAAFALAIALAVASGRTARWQPGRGELAAGLLLGLAAFGIEAGFFFIYRAGWPLASASVIANISVTAVLAVVGILVFGEHLSAMRVGGLLLAAVGVALLVRGHGAP
jgi:drug/metabolite transporter (DMT)-like permease